MVKTALKRRSYVILIRDMLAPNVITDTKSKFMQFVMHVLTLKSFNSFDRCDLPEV